MITGMNLKAQNREPKDRAGTKPVLGGALSIRLFMSFEYVGFSVSLPIITENFKMIKWYSLVVVLYFISETLTSPIGGKLGDQFGRKKVILISLLTIVSGAVICSVSMSLPVFVAGYLITGLGYGCALSMPVTLICDVSDPSERPQYMGLYTMVLNIGMLAGPFIAGLITDNLGFRITALYSVPFATVAFFLIWRYYPDTIRVKTTAFDFKGIVFLTLCVVPLVIGFNLGGRSLKWSSPLMIGMMLCTLVFAGIFIVNEIKVAEPIFPLRLFEHHSFSVSNILIIFVVPFTLLYSTYVNLYAEHGLNQSATVSGSLALPKTMAVIVLAVTIGKWIGRHREYSKRFILLLGVVVGMAELLMVVGAQSPHALPLTYLFMALLGVGDALYYMALQPYLQSELPMEDMGVGVSIQYFCMLMSVCLMSTVFGAIINMFADNMKKAFSAVCLFSLGSTLVFLLVAAVSVKNPAAPE